MINHPGRTTAASNKKLEKAVQTAHDHDHDYSELLIGVRRSFDLVKDSAIPLFSTDATGLYEIYLDSLPANERQIHTCRACQRFIEKFGGLVHINETGGIEPVMWNPIDVPRFYWMAFEKLRIRVLKARVTGVFLCTDTTWGTPVTGTWAHIAVTPPAELVYRERALTAWQATAAAKENFRTVITALQEFTMPMLDQALRLLRAETLTRSERFIGPVKWLRDLHDRPKGRAGENVLWRAISIAPESYFHPRSSVIGPLLEDIAAGMRFEDIQARFNAKMRPDIYQRPQAAPAGATIKQAEQLVEKLGIAQSLERRFALVGEMQTIWTPKAEEQKTEIGGGIFSHIKPKKNIPSVLNVDLPPSTMTWDKFSRTVMPSAEKISLLVPSQGNFEGRLTAVHDDAPNILKWDNPVSSYVYMRGSNAAQWGMLAGKWADVVAISPAPNLWGLDRKAYLGDCYLLVLDGCADGATDQGNGLFPEILKSDLHQVRSVIEAYSKTAKIERKPGQYACGIRVDKTWPQCTLRVFSVGSWVSYNIDRFD